MAFRYEDLDPTMFADVAKEFNFDSANLGVVEFPESFVADYVKFFTDEKWEVLEGDIYWPGSIGHGVLMFNGALSPRYIHSTNKIMEESLYADEGALVMPPGYYIVGECYDSVGIVFLTINLAKGTAEYGKIYFWSKAHDALGTGDNTLPPVYAAESFGDFLDGLVSEEEAEARMAERH